MNEDYSNSLFQGVNIFSDDIIFKNLTENIPQTFYIVDVETLIIKYINKTRPGLTMSDVVGKTISSFVVPEFQEIYSQKINEVIKSKGSVLFEVIGISRINPDGKAWYRTKISYISQTAQKKDTLLFLSEDISDEKRTEFDRINRSERIKSIINNTIDIICSIDLDYNLTEFNSIFAQNVRSGYNIDMQLGMPILQFIDPSKHLHLTSIYERAKKGEVCIDIEKFHTVKNNTIYFESSYNPIFDAQKKVVGISIFSKNISDRIKSEQKIISALKEKEILLAEIHHRIKNNLAMVSSLLQLQEMNINNDEAKEALSSSRKRIKSTALIHELLYRNESFQSVDLKNYLVELFDYLKTNNNYQLVLKGDDITFNLSTALPLGLMLNEIMLNSFKHSYKERLQGKTEINITTNNKMLNIDYCDCSGIFPESVDFKNSNTTGLMLIHTFAEQLKGSINLISNTPPHYLIQVPLDENQ